jgi:hypothetical protein
MPSPSGKKMQCLAVLSAMIAKFAATRLVIKHLNGCTWYHDHRKAKPEFF